MKVSDLMFLWNAQADSCNNWESLSLDEKIEFAEDVERNTCAHVCKVMADECRQRENIAAIYMMQAYDYAAEAIRARGNKA